MWCSGSSCLLGVRCEPMILIAEGQGITNIVGRFTTMPSHPLLYIL